jgi:ABC-type antimicrobial peptide transport system permease subunit
MIKHFLKTFSRVTLKEKTYSILNIGGLAIGLAASSIILLWLTDELNYNSINKNKEHIYKVISHHDYPDGFQTIDVNPGPLSPALAELPEVESSCRIINSGVRILFARGDKSFYEKGIYADPSVFNVLTIPVSQGDARALASNDWVMISKRLGRKYFGEELAIGKTLRLHNQADVTVKAVFDDIPANSTLSFDYILPYALYAGQDQYNNEWGAWTGGLTLVKLHNTEDKGKVEDKIHAAFTKPKIWVRWDDNVTLQLHAMNDWRLRDDFENGVQAGGRIRYIVALGAVAGFILLIACANFINLATARSVGRAKEVGVRKVIGAVKGSLMRQFLGECILLAFIAMTIGVILVHLSLPYFNDLTSKQLVIDYSNPAIIGGIIAIVLLTGILAGSYPSLFLSSLGVITALKGSGGKLAGSGVRKSLVVLQFTLSTLLVAVALVLYQQIKYMQEKDLGFDRDHVFYFEFYNSLGDHMDAFRQSALNNPAIKSVSRASSHPMPIQDGMVLDDTAWPGKTAADNVAFGYLRCDADFITLLGLDIVKGENFSPTISETAEPTYIINEEAAREMKLKDPVGVYLKAPVKGKIVGVVRDFNSVNLKRNIQPVILSLNPPKNGVMMVSYEDEKLQEALSTIEALHRQYSPDRPIEIEFMDDAFNKLYYEEIVSSKLAGSFTAIAIIISCLGLFGLVSFSAARRKKEIGIRKVLGAEVSQVVMLLCRDFFVLVGISLIIGLPIAWWVATKFLSGFRFHVELGAGLFVWTTVSMFGLAIIAVSFQSIRAAIRKPVESLKME